jgi:hypothetical protein
MGDNRAASRGRGEHRNGVTEGADVETVYFVKPRRYKYNSLLIIIVLKGSVFMEPTAKSAAAKDKKTPVSEMMKNAVKGTLISMIFSVAAKARMSSMGELVMIFSMAARTVTYSTVKPTMTPISSIPATGRSE